MRSGLTQFDKVTGWIPSSVAVRFCSLPGPDQGDSPGAELDGIGTWHGVQPLDEAVTWPAEVERFWLVRSNWNKKGGQVTAQCNIPEA